MKHTTIIICIALFIALPCVADNYIIKYMNGPSIKIGVKNRTCRVDSIFSSDEDIHWSNSTVTLIEAQNVKTKRTVYFPSPLYKVSNSSSNIFHRIWDYFVKDSHQSTRETYSYDLEEMLTNREFLLSEATDTIRIKTNDYFNDNREYYASFYMKGLKQIIPLEVENGDIIFERNKFLIDGIALPYKFILTIFYKEDDHYHEITNGMSLTMFDVKNE